MVSNGKLNIKVGRKMILKFRDENRNWNYKEVSDFVVGTLNIKDFILEYATDVKSRIEYELNNDSYEKMKLDLHNYQKNGDLNDKAWILIKIFRKTFSCYNGNYNDFYSVVKQILKYITPFYNFIYDRGTKEIYIFSSLDEAYLLGANGDTIEKIK